MEPTIFPGSLPVKLLDAQADEYAENIEAWRKIDVLYRGGPAIERLISDFLMKRQKELGDIYTERMKAFDYPNVFKPIVGFYEAALFEDDPQIQLSRAGAEVKNDDFWTTFLEDCDRDGCSYVDFWRDVFLSAVKYKSAWVLTDLPKSNPEDYPDLAAQRKSGVLNPYLVLYEPAAVINWDVDEYGGLLWACVKSSRVDRAFGKPDRKYDRWYYFDRTQYAIYESERKDDQSGTTGNLIANAAHALAAENKVPIKRVEVSDALWIGSSLYLRAIKHLNIHNAMDWGMYVACIPLLYIKGEYNEPPVNSPTSWLHLSDASSDIGYVEPSGKTYELTMKRLEALVEEMYREAGLHDQGKTANASHSAQSGYSKRMDAEPSRVLLNAYGDLIRAGMQDVLGYVALAAGQPDVEADVRGLQFEDDDETQEIQDTGEALALDIPSDTYVREEQKRFVSKRLKDANPKVLKTIHDEIDAAPSQSEKEAALQKSMQDRIQSGMRAAINPVPKIPSVAA